MQPRLARLTRSAVSSLHSGAVGSVPLSAVGSDVVDILAFSVKLMAGGQPNSEAACSG